MSSNFEKYKKDIGNLLNEGGQMIATLLSPDNTPSDKGKDQLISFHLNYENWYSEASSIIKQLLPDRIDDFQDLYEKKKRKEITAETYGIKDYLLGISINVGSRPLFDHKAVVFQKFQQQYLILISVKKRFESSLFDIKQLVQADVFDSEIEVARELLKRGFLRASGAVAGVVLEKYFCQVCNNHNIKIKKEDPSINDYNNALKGSEVIDTPLLQMILRLGAIRNLCVHEKKREPIKDEVSELIDGTEKIIKTLF